MFNWMSTVRKSWERPWTLRSLGQAESGVINSIERFWQQTFFLALVAWACPWWVHCPPVPCCLSLKPKETLRSEQETMLVLDLLLGWHLPLFLTLGWPQSIHAHICSMWWGLQSLVGGAASILSNTQFATDTQGEIGSQSQLKSVPLECILFENIANRTESRDSSNI